MKFLSFPNFNNSIFLNENERIPFQILLKFVPSKWQAFDNKPALVQVMAWRRIGAKPFPQLMLTQFTNAYMLHLGGMSKYIYIG